MRLTEAKVQEAPIYQEVGRSGIDGTGERDSSRVKAMIRRKKYKDDDAISWGSTVFALLIMYYEQMKSNL